MTNPNLSTTSALRGVRAVVGLVVRSLEDTRRQVTIQQLRVLMVARAKQPFLVGELADLLSVSPSAATRFAARLDRDGWVLRERDPDDRRTVSLRLTAKAEHLVEHVQQQRADELHAAFERMTESECRAVVIGLALLADALQEPGDPADLAALGFAPGLAPDLTANGA